MLIAGKGHENYQEVNGEQFHFDDLEEVNKYFNLFKKIACFIIYSNT